MPACPCGGAAGAEGEGIHEDIVDTVTVRRWVQDSGSRRGTGWGAGPLASPWQWEGRGGGGEGTNWDCVGRRFPHAPVHGALYCTAFLLSGMVYSFVHKCVCRCGRCRFAHAQSAATTRPLHQRDLDLHPPPGTQTPPSPRPDDRQQPHATAGVGRGHGRAAHVQRVGHGRHGPPGGGVPHRPGDDEDALCVAGEAGGPGGGRARGHVGGRKLAAGVGWVGAAAWAVHPVPVGPIGAQQAGGRRLLAGTPPGRRGRRDRESRACRV